ncbi:hypothetical protein ACLIYM_25370 [Streptomyces fenghuangensis]
MNDRTQQPRHTVPNHIPAHLHEAFATTKGRAITHPACPFKAGDPIQRHGYSGNYDRLSKTGFRGWVVGTVGATVLTGITTDGEEWWEEWGNLDPDGRPVDLWGGCTCCAAERRELLRAYYARKRAAGQQLGLFAEEVA